MSFKFSITPLAERTDIRIVESRVLAKRTLAVREWRGCPDQLQPSIRHLLALVERPEDAGDTLSLPNEVLLELPARVLATLGLPDPAAIMLRLELTGRVESPDGHIRVIWEDRSSRRLNPSVDGIMVQTAAGKGRLTSKTFRILRAVENYNGTKGEPDRISSWLPVQQEIEALTGDEVRPERLLSELKIYQAGAFGLDVRQSIEGPIFDPVLMGPGARESPIDDTPDALDNDDLTEAQAEKSALLRHSESEQFLKSFFADHLSTRPAYVVGRNTYVVVEPDTRAALDVVKRLRRASTTERQQFIKNPRSFLVEAMPELGEAAARIFVETPQYSDRVKGLGLWEKPNLAWLARKSTGWLPEGFVLPIGSRRLELDEDGLRELTEAAEKADSEGNSNVSFRGEDYSYDEVADALAKLSRDFAEEQGSFERDTSVDPEKQERDRNVLIIDDHIEQASSASTRQRRMEMPQVFPSDLVRTDPKRHQQEGFKWLVMAWKSGYPGVLLADDMGLGKTLQALSFLAWFRTNRSAMATGSAEFAGPILIVAPTALLRNWQKEAETHLQEDALGDCVEAFGPGLRRLRRPVGPDMALEDALDIDVLRAADWILTTYETLANYHRVFARIRFAVVLFDEMQKIKAPDTINTHAAKTVNADFVIGLTGTPIENRIEDLWCIMDRVAPGFLGSMKAFSKAYSGEDQLALEGLKKKLDQWDGVKPPIMLRRMKADHLPGLPERNFNHQYTQMPPRQAEAYEKVVRAAHQQRGNRNAMLKIIHDLRGVSLHPSGGGGIDPLNPSQRRQWIGDSARVSRTFGFLREIERKDEKALVFIEDRDVQETFAAVVAEEFKLPALPPIINGSLDGDKRQAVVDRFQAQKPGFSLMVLSPKAAGIGLTITAANHVIHLSRWWNPAVEDQCNDRVFRLGQEKAVTVHIPMARHADFGDGSFDMKLNTLLERKRALSRDMLVPPVWETDIDELFSAAIG
ncbi:DEAD/DEAH box helicase [bacterium M00.F.Ca.ET.159.01.1.1]|nr:DEAD/DEAH box helicase [bacterium M00.F.Ca.ET.159.01.1.1]